MFNSARLKLTLWYLLIIAVITVLFSFGIYRGFTQEFDRILQVQRYRMEHPGETPGRVIIRFPSSLPRRVDSQLISESEERIKLTLIFIDLTILVISALLGYFLAGKTLNPIEEMVSEQKRFVADASHELRTPLTALISEIEVALRDKRLSLSGAKKLLGSNLEEADKLKSLSDYLLVLSRYQGDQVNLDFSNVNFASVIKEVERRLEPIAKVKNIKLKVESADLSLEGNYNSLVELFSVLVDNAIKFSHKNSEVCIESKKEGNHLIASVKDSGVGIDPKDLPFIFNRFYQADSSRNDQREGFGLGLSIAKRITELHKGSIRAESSKGKGASFIVEIPLTKFKGYF